MDHRTMVVWLATGATTLGVVGLLSYAATQNVKARTETDVIKAQEQTKRAQGRHELLDIFGRLGKH